MRLQKAPPAAFFVSPTHSPHQSVSIGMRRAVTLFLLAILCCSSFGVVLTVPSLRQYNSIQRSVSKSDEDYNIPGAFIKPTLSFHASQKFVAYYAKGTCRRFRGLHINFYLLILFSLRSVVAKLINNNVSGLVIPELEFTDHQPGIGNVSVSLKNFTIKSMEASEDEAYGKLGNGSIEVKMSKIKFQIESQFQYQKLQYPRFHGKGLITFSGADGFLDLNFGVNETSGSPQLNIFAANSTFNQIKIKIKKSKAAWLYNLLIKIVKQKLDSAGKEGVNGGISRMISEFPSNPSSST